MTEKSKAEALIAEARALDAAATPGPWKAQPYVGDPGRSKEFGLVAPSCEELVTGDGFLMHERDAVFAARSRTLIVDLADALDRATEELRLLRLLRGECERGFSDGANGVEHSDPCMDHVPGPECICAVAPIKEALDAIEAWEAKRREAKDG